MKQTTTRDEFLSSIPGSGRGFAQLKRENEAFATDITEALVNYPDATHLVLFVNVDFSSSEFGRNQVLIAGPSNTFKSPEDCEGKWLNDLPSQRQYPQAYVSIEDWKNGEGTAVKHPGRS